MKKNLFKGIFALCFCALSVSSYAAADAASATASDPWDATSLISNPTFVSTDGWTITNNSKNSITYSTATGAYGFTNYLLAEEAAKQFKGLSVLQKLEGLPLGDYEVSVKVFKQQDGNRYNQGQIALYANGIKQKISDSKAPDVPGTAKVAVRVTDSILTIEVMETNNNNHLIAISDFSLLYYGMPDLAALQAEMAKYVGQKMLKQYQDLLTSGLAFDPAVKNADYLNAFNDLTTVKNNAEGSIADFADYKAVIDQFEAYFGAEQDFIVEHKANYEAGVESPKSKGWVNALRTAAANADATAFIVSPDMQDTTAWKISGKSYPYASTTVSFEENSLGFTGKYLKFSSSESNSRGKFANLTVAQTITGIPNGDYYVSMDAYYEEAANYGRTYLYLHANDKSAQFGKASANTVTTNKVKVRVSNGSLEIKALHQQDRNNIIALGNVKLQYVGDESWVKLNADSTAATASNMEEFYDALRFNQYKSDDVTITLNGGTYEMGTGLKSFGNFKNLTIQSTAGAKVRGSLSTNRFRLNSYTVDGITFLAGETSANNYSPFIVNNGGDTIRTFTIKNCTFENFALEQLLLYRANPGLIEEFIFEHNIVNNYGIDKEDGGNHAFQVNGKQGTQLGHFIMKESTFNNYQGKQFINFSNVGPVAASDSLMHVTIENNLFNKFSGNGQWNNAIQYRNFVEFTCGPKYTFKGAEININNNIFYENYCDTLGKANRIALDGAATPETYKVNILNNFFYPEDVMIQDGTLEDVMTFGLPLPIFGHDEFARGEKNYTSVDFPEYQYVSGQKLLRTHPMYTAGVDGKYIGLAEMYYEFEANETGAIVSTAEGLIQAMGYTYGIENPVIQLLDCTDEGGVYEIGGGYKKTGADRNMTIKAAEGSKPIVHGTLSASSYRMDNLTIDGLTFISDPSNSNENYSPIRVMNGNDTIGLFNVKNCTFFRLSKELVAQFRASNGYIGTFLFENNTVQEYGYGVQDGGNHCFQVNQAKFSIGEVIFRENSFLEYGGKQFLNFSNIGPVAGSDSIMHITMEHNNFIGFSGNGWYADKIQYRNFIEFTCGPKYKFKGADINVNNNLFYELNHTCDSLGIANRIALDATATAEAYKVNILNNFFYPEDVMVQDGTLEDVMEFGAALPIYGTENVTGNHNDLNMTVLNLTPEAFWADEEKTTIYKTSPLFTAGTEGTYIGIQSMYVKDIRNAKKIGYFTKQKAMDATAATVENDPIINFLNEDPNLYVEVNALSDVSAEAVLDLSNYDLVIVQETFGGGDKILTPAGALALSKIDKPFIYNKSFAVKSGRALSAGGATGKDANVMSIKVEKENQSWKLFEGIEFAGDSTVLFVSGTNDNGVVGATDKNGLVKGVNYVSGLNGIEQTLLAVPTGLDASTVSACVNFVPAGTDLSGEVTIADMFFFGMNSGALLAADGKNVTENNLKLWKNAVYILAGIIDEKPINNTYKVDGVSTPSVLNRVFANNGTIYVNVNKATTINVYSVMGSLVKTIDAKEGMNAINGLNGGQIYIVRTANEIAKVVL